MTAAHWLWVLFLFGVAWIFIVAAFVLPVLFILYGLALMAPAVFVASLTLYGSSSK